MDEAITPEQLEHTQYWGSILGHYLRNTLLQYIAKKFGSYTFLYIIVLPAMRNETTKQKAPIYESVGRGFESLSAYQFPESKDSGSFLYKENHALDAWFNKAYGDEQIAI